MRHLGFKATVVASLAAQVLLQKFAAMPRPADSPDSSGSYSGGSQETFTVYPSQGDMLTQTTNSML